MSREVRRVPLDWKHPEGHALYDGDYEKENAEWLAGLAKWKKGLRHDWKTKGDIEHGEANTVWEWIDWHGNQPRIGDYMPVFPEELCVGWQMYETCSEGTPISPVMESPDELADWLYNNNASAFGSSTASREQWAATIKAGWVISAVAIAETGLISGVAATTELP